MVGDERLGTFGSLPVRGGSTPVQCCLPLVPAHVADPGRGCPLMHDGDTLVRLGRLAERLRAGGQHLYGSRVRLGRVALSRFQPLTQVGGPAPRGVPVSFSELPQPHADGVKPGIDLPPTAWRRPRIAVHTSSMPDPPQMPSVTSASQQGPSTRATATGLGTNPACRYRSHVSRHRRYCGGYHRAPKRPARPATRHDGDRMGDRQIRPIWTVTGLPEL